MAKVCKDCLKENIQTTRPAIYPGPRCATHDRVFKKAQKLRASERRVEAVYGITAEQYNKLYLAQGGRCYICQWAQGLVKRLSVDHDHKTGVVRGLLCSGCNYNLLGRYSAEALVRALEYLETPPAIEAIGCQIVVLPRDADLKDE